MDQQVFFLLAGQRLESGCDKLSEFLRTQREQIHLLSRLTEANIHAQ